jgi:hypothetical protein
MRVWTFVKLISAVGVMGIMGFTGMLAYHVAVEPLGGVFARLIPDPGRIVNDQSDLEFARMLDSADMPDVDPGEKSFQKAHEMLAMGRLAEAREKLAAVVNVFPTSSSAPLARRILGEINLDEILSTSHMDGKQIYTVKPGDSFLGIAARHATTIDMLMHLNSMMELRNLQPGDELVLMPLGFRLLIEPQRKAVSLWDGGRFVKEYPVLSLSGLPDGPQRTTIGSKIAELDGRKVPSHEKQYRAASKVIQLAKPSLQIRGWEPVDGKAPPGILLRPHDMEELSLLTRPGNEVEIR